MAVLVESTRRRESRTPRRARPAIAIEAPRPGRRWILACAGGFGWAAGVFLFLAWQQPVMKDNERIELPEILSFRFRVTPEKAPPPPAQEPSRAQETEPPKRERPKETSKKLALKPAAARPIRRPASAGGGLRPAVAGFGLQNIALLAPAAGAGGGGLELPIGDAFEEIAGEALELARYNERRQAVREMAFQRDGASDALGAGMVASPPRAQYTPKPRYPQDALRKRLEGFVRLRLLVSREGKVEEVQVIAAQPEGVFEDAIETVLPRWQFRPASDRSGKPIEQWTEFNYVFKLEDA
ncbi:MAG: energy transducer TonB [Planctomycetes bacterium]|nr:energy transducer TonB [Planctomycetota bacterium]